MARPAVLARGEKRGEALIHLAKHLLPARVVAGESAVRHPFFSRSQPPTST